MNKYRIVEYVNASSPSTWIPQRRWWIFWVRLKFPLMIPGWVESCRQNALEVVMDAIKKDRSINVPHRQD